MSVSWVLALTLLVAACTGSGPSTTATAALREPPSGQGRLVVLDDQGNIVTLNPDGSDRIQITDDAGPTVRYFQPVWSPVSSTIAWGEARSSGSAVGIADGEGTNLQIAELPAFPFYLYWAPGGDRIGVLHNGGPGVLDFEVVDVDDLSARVLDSGSPYYFSWSPDGKEIVVHVGGDRLSVVDDSGDITPLNETRPNYLAPRWTSEGILYLSPDGVSLQAPGGEPRVLITADGFVSFVANPTGSRVAVQVLAGEPSSLTVGLDPVPEARRNVVSVVDVATGEVDVVSDGASLGFFWSPNGEKLMMLLLSSTEGDVDVAVWESGDTRVLTRLRLPASLIRDVLQFNDQYAQSWQMWAPNSSAFAIPGEREEESGVWVVSLDGSEPVLVSDGEWAAWSHQ